MSVSGDDLVSLGVAARMLRVSPRTLVRWVQEGRIPYTASDNGEPQLRREDVMRLMVAPEENDGPDDE